MPTSWHSVLIPARETRNQARRIALKIDIGDGRKCRKYKDGLTKGVILLRLNIRLSPPKVVARIGPPIKGEPFESDQKAIELLSELQSSFDLTYISPYRGHDPDFLNSVLRKVYQNSIERRFRNLGPNSKDSREMKSYAEKIGRISKELLGPFADELVNTLPNGMRPATKLEANIDIWGLISMISSEARLSVSTGSHDESFVSPDKVGSGLRSLLELNVMTIAASGKRTILAIEEPEAFLHPIAQRMLAKELQKVDVYQRLISTHSPIMVEESDLSGVVVVQEHTFYPSNISTARSKEIKLALLKKHGAELLFAKSVLLVEGESDYFFFEKLRERLQQVDNNGLLNGLYVLPVGGKEIFCPYVELIDSFGVNNHPIKWLIVADGDAHTSLRQTMKGLKLSVSAEVDLILKNLSLTANGADIKEWLNLTTVLNNVLSNQGYNIVLFPGDLEFSILDKAKAPLISDLCNKVNLKDRACKKRLLKKLGSKGVDGKQSDRTQKGPWIRAHIGNTITSAEMTEVLRAVLEKWVKPLDVNRRVLNELLLKI